MPEYVNLACCKFWLISSGNWLKVFRDLYIQVNIVENIFNYCPRLTNLPFECFVFLNKPKALESLHVLWSNEVIVSTHQNDNKFQLRRLEEELFEDFLKSSWNLVTICDYNSFSRCIFHSYQSHGFLHFIGNSENCYSPSSTFSIEEKL